MSLLDKANNKFQSLTGTVKEMVGRVTGNKSQQAEGHRDQGKADLKDAGEKVKDAFKK